MAGRRPKPTALMMTAGNPGKRALRNEPHYSDTEPTPPDYLAAMPEAMRAWSIAADELRRAGNFKRAFQAVIEGFCIAYAMLVQASAKLQADGLFDVDNEKHTAIGVANAAAKELRAFAAELGFSPASVSRVAVVPEKTHSSLREFVASKHG